MKYVFDTNILLHYLRNEPDSIVNLLEMKYNPLDIDNTPIVCVVSIGELKSLAKRNRWGKKRIENMEKFLQLFVVVNIYAEDVLDMYAEIDTYSQNKILEKPLPFSVRNMGKNDVWIAAITTILGATLITLDNDFDHLDGVYFEILNPLK